MTCIKLAVTVRDSKYNVGGVCTDLALSEPSKCSVYACGSPAWPTTPCGRDLCAAHSQALYHPCVAHYERTGHCAERCEGNDPLFALIARILDSPIGQAATALRGPARVLIPPVTYSENGYTAEGLEDCSLDLLVEFDDGANWRARVSFPGTETVRGSEVVTMLAGRELTSSVPQCWESELGLVVPWDESDPADTGLSVLFVERPLPITPSPTALIDSLAEFYIALSKRSYTGVGSLTTRKGETVIGPLINPIKTYRLFRTTADAHIARFDDLILDTGKLPPGTKGRLTRFCAAVEARELVRACEEMNHEGQTFLRHVDLGNHMVFGASGLSVGNWEYATTAPWLEAFAFPRALLPASYTTANDITAPEHALAHALHDRGAYRLVAGAYKARKYHRLHDLHDNAPLTLDDVHLLRHAFNPRAARPTSLVAWRKDVLRAHALSAEVRGFVGAMMGLEDGWDGRDVAVGKALAQEFKTLVDELDYASRTKDEAGKNLSEMADRLDLALDGVLVRVERLERDGGR